MPVDYYPNQSIAKLVVLLNSLQGRQVSGALTEVQAAGVRTVRNLSGSGGSKPEVEILRVLYSLYKRALGTDEEANYPNPYKGRITRTGAAYRAPIGESL